MGFQKINIREPIQKCRGYPLGLSPRQSHLNEPKKISSKLSSWDFIFFLNFNY
jgi:hypothetical protein